VGVLVVGESLVDIVRRDDGSTETFPGGSAANVAVALARLGRGTGGFVTSFADDEHGRLIAEHLAASGVRLATDPHVVPRTSSALATLQPDGSARYTFDIDWRIGPVEVTDPPLAVHACSLGAVLTPGCADVRTLLERLRPTSTTSYDINMRPSVTGVGPAIAATVEETVALSDLVKASDEDLEALREALSDMAAAGADPEATQVLAEHDQRRYETQRRLARRLHWRKQLKRGLTAREAADIIWTLASERTYLALVRDRGRKPHAYERWVVEQLVAGLLPEL
jgi:sugar/nucleoside kinase (ribokinase family)